MKFFGKTPCMKGNKPSCMKFWSKLHAWSFPLGNLSHEVFIQNKFSFSKHSSWGFFLNNTFMHEVSLWQVLIMKFRSKLHAWSFRLGNSGHEIFPQHHTHEVSLGSTSFSEVLIKTSCMKFPFLVNPIHEVSVKTACMKFPFGKS